jgi:hypothetical protein
MKIRIALDTHRDSVSDIQSAATFLHSVMGIVSSLLPEPRREWVPPVAPVVPVAPAAPPVTASAPTPSFEARMEAVTQGRDVFHKLVASWCSNFEVKDAPQPDRTSLLLAAFTGYGRVTSLYIREKGGLASAVIDGLLGQNLVASDEAVKLGKRIAGNMVQVATVMSIPLDGMMEKSLYSTPTAATDDTWPTGGLLADTVPMERPPMPSGT